MTFLTPCFFRKVNGLLIWPTLKFLVSVAQGDDGGVGFPLEPYGHDTQFRHPAACAPDNIFRINAVSGYQA